jgi:hypothetical protein
LRNALQMLVNILTFLMEKTWFTKRIDPHLKRSSPEAHNPTRKGGNPKFSKI